MSKQQNQDEIKTISASSSSSSPAKNSTASLPIATDKDKLSRALGAAFLQHKVKQLERNLDDLSFRRDIIPKSTHLSHTSGRAFDKTSLTDRSKSKAKFNSAPIPQPSNSKVPITVKIIDTSILIHALPVLKKWTRDALFKIIIPLDVISELDFLKNSPPPINRLVREATNWLDSQFKNSQQRQMTNSAINEPSFIPQRTGDESKWDELSQRFIAPPIEVASIKVLSGELVKDESEVDQPEWIERALNPTDLPPRYRSLLQCTLYYQIHAQPNQKTELVIFILDHHQTNLTNYSYSQSSPQPFKSSSAITLLNKSNEVNFSTQEEPSEENLPQLSEWAYHFQLQVHKIFPSDLVKLNQSNRNQNQNHNQNQKKVNILTHPNHHRPSYQARPLLKAQLHPIPSQQSPSKPNTSQSNPIAPRTILTRNRDTDPSPSTSSNPS